MPTEAPIQNYRGMFRLEKPVRVWTPTGEYNAPKLIATTKTPPSMDFEQAAEYLRKQSPRQRLLTFGESFQSMLALEGVAEGKAIAKDMVTGAYERTGTIAVYKGARRSDDGSFYHGRMVMIPLFGTDGKMLTDGNGVPKCRYEFECALPAKSDFAKNQPKDCDTFLDTLYGMEGARKKLPNNALIVVCPEGELDNFLRGRWRCGYRGTGRVSADGGWKPSRSDERVASRGTLDNARLVNRLNEAEYAANLDGLFQSAKQAPPEKAAEIIGQINLLMNDALVWEDI